MKVDNTTTNPLTAWLDKKFTAADTNGDGSLDKTEFKPFGDLLKPGIALDKNGQPSFDMQAKMDHDGDGNVSREEMQTTGVLMPASMTADSLGAVLQQQANAGPAPSSGSYRPGSLVDIVAQLTGTDTNKG